MAPPLPITFGAASARGFGLFSAPAALASDPYFEYVTMLLHGDGTNGAQNNTFLDSSTNAFTITRNGNTTQGSFSPFSRADGYWSNYFDGNGDYLDTPASSALSLTGQFTVECWYYQNSTTQYSTIFELAQYTDGILFRARNDSTGGVWINGTQVITGGSPALSSIGTWSHFAITRNGSNSLSIYLNGSRIYNATISGTINSGSGYLRIGASQHSAGQFHDGYITNMRVVKGSSVYDPTQTTLTVPTSPLTAITNTSLLTCQNNRFKDNSTNTLSITPTGNPSIQVFNPFNPTAAYSTSTNGGSGFFDGSGDYLTVPDNAAFDMGTGDVTIEAWIYVTNIPSSTAQGIFGNLNTGYEFYMYPYGPANTIAIGVQTFEGGYAQTYITNNYVRINEWTHVAFTRASGTNRFFVNGVLCTTTGTLTNALNASGTQEIGRRAYAPTDYFYGYMSNLRIVKGTAVYTAAFTPPTAPLTAISGTSLLLSFTNAGIFDNAAMNNLETVGNAQISTSVKKFGTGSLAFDATDDRLVMAGSPNFAFGTGDFTIEFWMNSSDVSSTQRGPFQISNVAGGLSTSGASGISIIQGGNSTGAALNGGLYAYILNTVVGSNTPVLSTGTWYHIAVTRQSGTVRLFVDGNLHASGTVSGDMTGQNLVVGGYYSTSYLYNGYLDDFRITKGYARYTANFTPPTAAFPDL